MKRTFGLLPVCLLALYLFILSCSGSSNDGSIPATQVPVEPMTAPEANTSVVSPVCSGTINKLVEEAAKLSYTGAVAQGAEAARDRCLFNLKDTEVLNGDCKGIIEAAGTCRVQFTRNNTVCVAVCEWTFANAQEATKVQNAITSPLSQQQKMSGYERFYSNPFTFWQHENKLYYLYSVRETQRPDMDKLNDLLTSLLGPEDKLY